MNRRPRAVGRGGLVLGILAVVGAGVSPVAAQEPRPEVQETAPLRVLPGKEAFPGKAPGNRFPFTLTLAVGDRKTVVGALGSGVRRKLIFDVYEAVAYADTSVDLSRNPEARLIEGDLARRLEMHFIRAVDASRTRDAMEQGVENAFGEEPVSLAMEQDIGRFMSLFDNGGVQPGDTIVLTWLPGEGLFVTRNRETSPPIRNLRLANGLFSIWFGDPPLNEGLRRNLLRLLIPDPLLGTPSPESGG